MLCYKCGHQWNYRGRNSEGKGYITCPGCYYKIRSDKALIEEPFKQKLPTSLLRKEQLPTKLLSKLPTKKKIPKELPTNLPTILSPLQIESEEQEENLVEIKDIPWNDFDIRIIPIDPIKILEHQRSFLR